MEIIILKTAWFSPDGVSLYYLQSGHIYNLDMLSARRLIMKGLAKERSGKKK